VSFSHPFGAFNVEGSLNEWVRVNLTAAGVPSWMPSARVVFDMPRTDLISGHGGHAFAVTHLGAPDVIEAYQGHNTYGGSAGQLMTNLMQVDCYISREQAGEAYNAKLRQQGDMVTRLFSTGTSVLISNLYTGAGAPTANGGVITLHPARGQGVPQEPNPDLKRLRYLVSYQWMERV
jgi:hypothetical protein